MEFPRQEYWSGLPFLPSGDLPDPGIEPTSLMSPATAGRFFFLPLVPVGKLAFAPEMPSKKRDPFSHGISGAKASFPGGLDGEESACKAVDLGSIPGSGRSPKENGNPL